MLKSSHCTFQSVREDALNVFGLLDLSQLTELFEWHENPREAG
jgi:hypothetical protein